MIYTQLAGQPDSTIQSVSAEKASVVLVHGLTCTHNDWALQVADLSKHFQCVAVDLRSHGRSASMGAPRDMDTMAADVINACTQLGIESAVFAGHSMGTRIIASLADQAPALVNGLVFIDGSRQATDDPVNATQQLEAHFGNSLTSRTFIELMFDKMFTADSDPELRRAIIERAVNTPADVFLDLLSQMLVWDSTRMEQVFRSIQAPVHAIQSTTLNEQRVRRSLQADESVPYLEFMKSTIPQARTEVVAQIGHFTQLDAPATVTRALRDMLTNTNLA